MRYKYLMILMLTVFLSCKKEIVTPPPPPADPTPPVLLKNVEIPHLPAPYYHFEYDASGKAKFVSFASDFTRYDIFYDGDRIVEMRNNILVNKDRLQYHYDNQGKVSFIEYADSTGVVFSKSTFTYNGPQLVKAERYYKDQSEFIVERTMTMIYNAEGNLKELTDHRPATNQGQIESTATWMFEQYDDKINVDGFSLLHPDFFEHLFLLPGIKLQINNPRKETLTGDGLHLKIEHNYTYNEKNLPVIKSSNITITNGSDSGRVIHDNTTFSYYE